MLMTGSDADNNNDKTDENELERRRKKREEELYDIFYLFDKDRSGYISHTELEIVECHLHIQLPQQHVLEKYYQLLSFRLSI